MPKFLLTRFEFSSFTRVAALIVGSALLRNTAARLPQGHASESDKADPKIALVSNKSSANDRPVIIGDDILIDGVVESGDLANGFIIKTISFKNSSGRVGDISGKEKTVFISSGAKWFRYNGEEAEGIEAPSATFNFKDVRLQVIGKNSQAGLNAKYVILPENTTTKVLLAVSPPGKETTPKQDTDVQLPKPVSELDTLVLSQFALFGSALEIPSDELQDPQIENHGTFISASTDKWSYRIDISGNQTLRPLTNLPYIEHSYDTETPIDEFSVPTASLIETAKELTSTLGYDSVVNLSRPVVRKEVLLLSQCGSGNPIHSYEGRSLTRLIWPNDTNIYFQVVCDPNDKPIRIDTSVRTDTVKKLSSLILQTFQKGQDNLNSKNNDEKFIIANFYDGSEDRFEVNAVSFEGLNYLDPKAPLGSSFKHDNFDGVPSKYLINGKYDFNRPDIINLQVWQQTQDFKFWQEHFWNLYGRLGGARGNYHSSTQTWDNPNVELVRHPLKEYATLDGPTEQTNNFTLSDGVVA